jgi:hypothetical protein
MMDLQGIEREAREETGLADFGVGHWREGMERLADAAAAEARLNTTGFATLRAEFLAQLINRLEIEDWVKRHPEIQEEEIEAPIVLATLPRTGQTAAGWIFDRDPANRALYTWQAKRPVPPPLPNPDSVDPRILRERANLEQAPAELRRMHLSDAEEPDECHFLISNAFRGAHNIYTMHVPSHYAWSVDQTEMSEAYAYYRLQLQSLQSRTPGRRWVLKSSPHLLHLDELHAALPGAHYVQFHRDPLVANPVAQVERIYDELGIPLSGVAREAMHRWRKANPRDSRRPDPNLEPFGLDANELRRDFSDYCARFGLTG